MFASRQGGIVMTADGILIGGEQGTGEAGVLARKREIRDLEREIDELRPERDRRSREEEGIRRERASLEERLAAFFRGREDARSAHAAAERGKAVLFETLAQARALLDGRSREDAFLRGELARMSGELSASLATARASEHARGEEETRSRALL
jgi:chromosome segregation ATPase